MSRMTDFTVPSTVPGRTLHAFCCEPEGEVRAVLQLSHGMVEFIDRYKPLAEYLAGQGIVVVGHDHLGHGGSIRTKEDYGYFGEPDGNRALLQQLAEAVTPFAFNNKEVPRLQCAVVRRTHSGTQNVFQLLADGCRFGQAGSATTVNKQFKCVHWLTPLLKFTHKINTAADFVTA